MVHEEQDDGPPATGLAELDRLRELWRHDPARTSLENHFWSRSGYVVPRVVALLDDDGCDDDTARGALDLLCEVAKVVGEVRDHTGDDYGAWQKVEDELEVLRRIDPSTCTPWRAWAVRTALMLPGPGRPVPPDWDPWQDLEVVLADETAQTRSMVDAPVPWVRREVAGRVGLPVTLQERVAEDADPSVRVALAGNPSAAPEVLAALARDDDLAVVIAVAGNPSAQAAILDELARRVEDDGVRVAVIQHPSVDSSTLDRLALADSLTVRIWALGNPACPIDTVLSAARQGEPAAAGNPALGADQLRELAEDPAVADRSVAANPNCPPELLRLLVRRAPTDLPTGPAAVAAMHPNCPPDLAVELLDSRFGDIARSTAEHQPLTPELLARLVRDGTDLYPADVWTWPVAQNPNCPPELLEEIDRAHPGADVTLHLPPDPSTPPELVDSLHYQQRWRLAGDPTTSPELLRTLAESGVRSAVMANSGAPAELLLDLVAGPDNGDFLGLRLNKGLPSWLSFAASSTNPVEALATLALVLHLRSGGDRDRALAIAVADLAPDWPGNPAGLLDAALARVDR